ncbi:hypothetical protein PRUPE_4G162500 [Prunus persica]|uniref:Uncharacterized protein n=1 Tax=Prunus persica TaxID=3760 RepID=A0A251PLH6_PRUPE|nr:hypothetical protein PRUPE_4G162500 [Prunus persica]
MNCTNLIEIHLEANNLEGDITALKIIGIFPTSLYSCRSLKAIRLAGNHLEGQIQLDIFSLKSLSFLSLGYNLFTNLTGAMKILMSCKSLRLLMLTGSFIGEGMPTDDDKLKSLEILFLVGNQITRPVRSWLGALPRLLHIRLAHNRLSGEFPKQLCKVDSYEFELPPFGPFIIGPISLQRKLSFFGASINLSNSNLEGEIPIEIGQLQLLRELHLDSNNFTGIIPNQISNLKNLEACKENLNLSLTHLSGKIPSSLASLHFLKQFNASYNSLQGPVPISTHIQSFDASAFEGNPNLCDNKNNKGVDNGHQFPWFYISSAFGFIVGFWGVCGSLIIKKRCRYAYFGFIDNVQDRLYVMVKVRINMQSKDAEGHLLHHGANEKTPQAIHALFSHLIASR